ncbi:unnamed protein product [Didymodactylos carnosus]|uniref:DUF4218 domain-containing protein n=1 Tax=Didymodactylos carnosus TaxID=1234261 RepID=A0A8S2FKZ6_9BILA|nr:unnamed protein product [Didymodactylos carnosus]CAF4283502.1 unnamed protein product [Didymodactylos carnosus]
MSGICKYHLNAFLQICVETNRFTLPQFCKGLNEFPYSGSESLSKPSMNITIEDLKNWASGFPLDAMQMYYLFMNLPYILRKLLKNSQIPAYEAILLLVDIVNLTWSSEADDQTVLELQESIIKHNKLYKHLYPANIKPKFHFLLHFPRQMKLFGPLRYLTTLTSERKHQYTKGIKMRCFENPALTVTKRLPAWECVKDHNDDGTLACNLFKHNTIFSQSQPLSDDLRLNIDQWKLPDLPTHVASSIQFIQFCIQSEQLFVYLTTI